MRKATPSSPKIFTNEKQSTRSNSNRFKLSFRDKIQTSCAFHLNQTITNFCKDPACLLPLCPKCIKIHSQQHAEQGTFSSFQSIEDCLQEAHQGYVNLFTDVNRLQKISFQIQESYKKKKQQTMKKFHKAKNEALNYLNGLFDQYQEALKLQIAKDQRNFTEGLIIYHGYIGKIMQKSRNGTKKFNTKHLAMEGLINFYNEAPLRQELKQCEENLNNYCIKNIEIYTNDYELENLGAIVKKYLRFGDDEQNLDSLLAQNMMNKDINLNKKAEVDHLFYGELDSYRSFNHSLANSIKGSYRGLEQMESPLDKFSLQRSRNVRQRISQRKNYIN